MAIHRERRRLCYSPQQIFELVAQVERYPEFLPLWHSVRVSHKEQTDSEHQVYVTDQVIKIGPLYKRFRTRTTLEAFRRIHVVSTDPLFRQFSIDWSFSSEKEDSCQIDFTLNCEASSFLLQPVFDVALLDTARSIVSAFENRARSIYDH